MFPHKTWLKYNQANPRIALSAGRQRGYFVASCEVSTPRDDKSRPRFLSASRAMPVGER